MKQLAMEIELRLQSVVSHRLADIINMTLMPVVARLQDAATALEKLKEPLKCSAPAAAAETTSEVAAGWPTVRARINDQAVDRPVVKTRSCPGGLLTLDEGTSVGFTAVPMQFLPLSYFSPKIGTEQKQFRYCSNKHTFR